VKLRHGLLAVAIAAIVAACSSPAATTSPTTAGTAPATAAASPASSPAGSPAAAGALQVYAAASLKNALAKVADVYQAANPGTTLTVSTDSSSALETKIEQGAPADVFLSADTSNPKKLVDAGLASGSVEPFAGNLLTIIVPKGNPAGIQSPKDLAKPGIKVIAAGDTVPITKYATQLVGNLAKESGYPADFAASYANNVASKEDNVSGIVTKIGLGEGDAGIVYVTDAKSSDKVDTVDVPADANVPATYGGVVVKASQNQDAAKAFLDWLASGAGQQVLATFGFLPPAS
jgi:molybdate transport system substrate-binding protein